MKEDEDTYIAVVESILDGANTFTLMKHMLLRHTHK